MNFLIKDEFHCKQQFFITKYSFSNQENYRSDLCEGDYKVWWFHVLSCLIHH